MGLAILADGYPDAGGDRGGAMHGPFGAVLGGPRHTSCVGVSATPVGLRRRPATGTYSLTRSAASLCIGGVTCV